MPETRHLTDTRYSRLETHRDELGDILDTSQLLMSQALHTHTAGIYCKHDTLLCAWLACLKQIHATQACVSAPSRRPIMSAYTHRRHPLTGRSSPNTAESHPPVKSEERHDHNRGSTNTASSCMPVFDNILWDFRSSSTDDSTHLACMRENV